MELFQGPSCLINTKNVNLIWYMNYMNNQKYPYYYIIIKL